MFFIGIGLILLWLGLTIINVWCIAVMLFLVFDKAYLAPLERKHLTKEYRRGKLKVIKGDKDETTSKHPNDV